MNNERRNRGRFVTRLSVKWDGMTGTTEAHLTDISFGGCFVDTTGVVEINEVVNLNIQLPSGEWLAIHGKVATYQPTIGFGFVFSVLNEDEQEALSLLMSSLSDTSL